MKKVYYFQLICIMFTVNVSVAQETKARKPQKKIIENDSYKKWEKLNYYAISNDGRYAFYLVGSLIAGNSYSVLKSCDGSWMKKFPFLLNSGKFTESGGKFIAQLPGDSLIIINLRKKSEIFYPSVKEFQIVKSGNSNLLLIGFGNRLVVKNLDTGIEHRFSDVLNYKINMPGTVVIISQSNHTKWVDLSTFQETIIYNGASINQTFDRSGRQVLFVKEQAENGNGIYYYSPNMLSAEIKVSSKMLGMPNGFDIVREDFNFSPDGRIIYFRLKSCLKNVKPDPEVISANVNVWHYNDVFIQSNQRNPGFSLDLDSRTYISAVFIDKAHAIQLENDTLKVISDLSNNYVIVKGVKNETEAYFNIHQRPHFWLVNLQSGERKKIIPDSTRLSVQPRLSPTEKYVSWADFDRNFFIYNISTGLNVNITQKILVPQDLNTETNMSRQYRFNERLFWTWNDKTCLIEDKYDLWEVDPMSNNSPINVTGGFGRKNRIKFDLVNNDLRNERKGDRILVRQLKLDTKHNGFSTIILGNAQAPELGIMEPYLYSWDMVNGPGPVIKARNAAAYLVTRQSVEESPNLYLTKDFKKYFKLSDIYPEKQFNWLTSELFNYKMSDGKYNQAILYKPNNFDKRRKYPVIFYYYQKKSDDLHKYLLLDDSGGLLNIPFYVSNGYLVCVPDILYYEHGQIAKIAVRAVEGAANFLSNLDYVDNKKMGLQGHSFGGYETNLLIANSNLFAAAQSSSGASDIISKAGSLGFGDRSLYNIAEIGQTNLGSTPWENPSVYIENSPLFNVGRVTTPLLMLHGPKDIQVPWAQALEFYLALRRAGKRVWLLEYDGSGHALAFGTTHYWDFILRQQQFFDHYLKGKPAPLWMVEGISAKFKGIKSGLQLDSLNRTP